MRVDAIFAQMPDINAAQQTPAQTIDEVVARLAGCVARARAAGSRLGYFAALYKRVTVRVRQGILDGEFQDGPRMAQLDVMFANRYLEAYDQHIRSAPTTRSWEVAFAAAPLWRPLILQHLLLGMNAHINLDLGIAAARTGGVELGALRADFDHINVILGGLTAIVKRDLEQVWPALRLVNTLMQHDDDAMLKFSMTAARDAAWNLATRLAPLDAQDQAMQIDAADQVVGLFGGMLRDPDPLLRWSLRLIRLGERGSVPAVIDLLSG